MALHKSPSTVEVNRNTDWLSSPGTWTAYASAVFFCWLVCCSWTDAGNAWSTTLVVHSIVTFYLLHWKKGAPFQFDQDDYKKLTFWEQMDAGVQLTKNKKFFMAMPVVLFLLASHVTEYRQPMMSINFVLTVVLLIGKLPNMYKVRIFGINED